MYPAGFFEIIMDRLTVRCLPFPLFWNRDVDYDYRGVGLLVCLLSPHCKF